MERLIEFSTNHWELMAALVVTLLMLAHSFFAPHFRKYKALTPMEATALINQKDALVLDVRETHEFNSGHILDAQHIPLAAIDKRIDELREHQARPVIVACKTGTRAGGACNKLVKGGFGEVYALRGGVAEWQNANLPISKAGRPKKRK